MLKLGLFTHFIITFILNRSFLALSNTFMLFPFLLTVVKCYSYLAHAGVVCASLPLLFLPFSPIPFNDALFLMMKL